MVSRTGVALLVFFGLAGLIASWFFRLYQFLGITYPEHVALQSLSVVSGVFALPVVWHLAHSYADRCRAYIVATAPTHAPGVAP